MQSTQIYLAWAMFSISGVKGTTGLLTAPWNPNGKWDVLEREKTVYSGGTTMKSQSRSESKYRIDDRCTQISGKHLIPLNLHKDQTTLGFCSWLCQKGAKYLNLSNVKF
jgi:hypothetical protein